MSGQYPEILFHFTEKKESLEGILLEGFHLSFGRETIVNNSSDRKFAVPMVSFCDLRLSELPVHMRKYGRFGIGMRKDWAHRHGLNPVAYVNKGSEFTNLLLEGMVDLHKELNDINDVEQFTRLSTTFMNIMNVQRYIKNYEGHLFRNGVDQGFYRFADEREWRYVLPLNTKNILPFIPFDQINTPTAKKFFNEQVKAMPLKFTAIDVKYLIVPTESDVRPLRLYIDTLSVFSDKDKEHLTARILTADQVEDDM